MPSRIVETSATCSAGAGTLESAVSAHQSPPDPDLSRLSRAARHNGQDPPARPVVPARRGSPGGPRLKTLFISSDFKPERGGIAELYANLLARFPAASVEVSTVRAPDGWRDDVGYTVRRMPWGVRESSRFQTLVRWTAQARRRVRELGADAVQIGTLRPAGPIGASLQALEGVPFVVYVHGKDVLKEHAKVRRSRGYRATARACLGRAGAVIANSRFTAELVRDLARAAGAPEVETRVRVVHPGADPERFRPGAGGSSSMRHALGLTGKRIVLTVARLVPRKGVDVALDAVAALAPEFPDLVYVVVGEGQERTALERRAAGRDLAGRVVFTGDLPDADLPACYGMAEVFLFPSRRERGDEVEGFGIVAREASASGIPVLGGASGGVPEAVIDGETGLLADPEDPRAIATTLRRLLEDRDLAARLGRNGRESVLRWFNWDRAAAEAWSILEDVVGRCGSRS